MNREDVNRASAVIQKTYDKNLLYQCLKKYSNIKYEIYNTMVNIMRLLGYGLYPFAWLIGIPNEDCSVAGDHMKF
ncbi:hypothetical protein Avbf_10332 [Armadillidium vulgare]|nr:hypothetical protein Avbf_10332 [Armadillidium vulgare]